MDEQRQDDQLEPIYNSSEPIQDVALKTYRERWMIEMGGKAGSGRSVLVACHEDDDEVLPLRARVDLGAMATKGSFAFSKAPALLEPHQQIV